MRKIVDFAVGVRVLESESGSSACYCAAQFSSQVELEVVKV
jgi:hypothetical protein